MVVYMSPHIQGLRDALDEATLERQTLVTELGRQREGERRKVQELEDRLKQKEVANSNLEKVGLGSDHCLVGRNALDPSSSPLPRPCRNVRSSWRASLPTCVTSGRRRPSSRITWQPWEIMATVTTSSSRTWSAYGGGGKAQQQNDRCGVLLPTGAPVTEER